MKSLTKIYKTFNKFLSILLLSVLIIPFASYADDDEEDSFLNYEFNLFEKLKFDYQPSAHTPDMFGDKYDNGTGTIKFEYTDISLPGNSNLEVALRRSYNTTGNDPVGRLNNPTAGGGVYSFGGFHIETPRIVYQVLIRQSSVDVGAQELDHYWPDALTNNTHCSGLHNRGFEEVRISTNEGFTGGGVSYPLEPDDYNHPLNIIIPGQVSEPLLLNDNTLVGANSSHRFTTKSKWKISCLTTLPNNQQGEGFIATSPQGVTYTFDLIHLEGKTVNYFDTEAGVFNVRNMRFLATKVEDRFGNWVRYNYTNAVLNSITSNDGREITLGSTVGTSGNYSYATANGRVWKYKKTVLPQGGVIDELEYPDGRKWQFAMDHHQFRNFDHSPGYEKSPDTCFFYTNQNYSRTFDLQGSDTLPTESSITITHPDGAIGKFWLGYTVQGRSDVDPSLDENLTYKESRCSFQYSLLKKSITYNGNNHYEWKYDYSANDGSYLSSSSVEQNLLSGYIPSNVNNFDFKTVKVINPDNSYVVSYINRRASSYSEGKVFAEVYYSSNGTKLKEIHNSYIAGTKFGSDYLHSLTALDEENAQTPKLTQVKTIMYDGGTATVYTKDFGNFDSYDIPQYIKLDNGFNTNERHIKREFRHDTANWVLSQPTKTYLSDSTSFGSTPVVEYTYHNGSTAGGAYNGLNLVYEEKRFGSWMERHSSYHNDGNVKKTEFNQAIVKANGSAGSGYRYVERTGYKRGQPTQFKYAGRYSDTTGGVISQSQTIDNNGWVTSITDLNGNTTGYGYNDMGRATYVDSPSDANNTWLDTFIDWNYNASGYLELIESRCQLNTAKNGCANTAKNQTITSFDGMLRAKLVNKKDVIRNINRYQNQTYNYLNAPLFSSFWSVSSTENSGTTSSYDGLQRKESDIITGGGIQTTEYLANNKIKTTDAENNVTTTTYLAYGSPSYKQATLIQSPENVTTNIVTNLFGNINSITQSGFNSGTAISQTEYRAYDSHQQLCQIARNDVGATVINRKTNGEINWQAQGQTVSSYTVCNTTAPANSKVSFTYDNLGSQRTISYGDGTPTRTFVLDNNGNVKTISGQGFSQSYNYNSLDMLEDETLNVTGRTGSMTLNYGYDNLGSLASLQYPDGLAEIKFAPNAFGEATQAIRTYSDSTTDVFIEGGASEATYYPNGLVNTFTYGNGIVHKTTLNNRLIPSKITDKLGTADRVNLSYTYDNNSNVTSLINTRDAGIYSLTNLTYDGLDRLLSTTGGSGIGSSTMSYDSLGNIRTYSNNSLFNPSNLTYSYKSNFQLNDVKTTGTTTKIRDFSSGNSYDARGNVKSNGNTTGKNTFSYNLANQMTSAGGNSYVYDGYNRRVKSQDSKGTSYSFYSQSGKLLYRETPQGGINYIFLGDKLIAKEGAGVVSSGDSIMNYKPFGESIEEPKDEVGYTGHKFDTDLGLSYMQARYYDPVIGRFYSNDPVGYTSKNPVMSFNRYLYVNNNPYKYTDPNGEFLWVGAAIGGAIGFASSVGTQLYKNGSVDNWGTVAAATATGAAVGFTGGLATAAVGKIGLAGAEAFGAVAMPSATVAGVGGGLTQMVSNVESGAPLNEGVATATVVAAVGTVGGGALGQLGDDALKAGSRLGGQGALNNAGKAVSEGITTVAQETLTQGASKVVEKIDE